MILLAQQGDFILPSGRPNALAAHAAVTWPCNYRAHMSTPNVLRIYSCVRMEIGYSTLKNYRVSVTALYIHLGVTYIHQ